MLALENLIDIEVTLLELHELEVVASRPDFDDELARIVVAARAGRTGDPARARALFRRFGIDPTKQRPSSEALLRRVKRGEQMPRINSLVDVANVLSLQLQVPIGLYDLALIEGPLTLRLGVDGEAYAGIGREVVNVSGRICVADALGPCGSPTADSLRTRITTATEGAAWIFFLPVAEPDLLATYELVARFGRGLVRIP